MMYTHARQFPHLTGISDDEIRDLARAAFRKHPILARIRRIRNVVLIAAMAIGAKALMAFGVRLGWTLVIVGATGTVVVLVWNLIWLNTVLFRFTQEEKLFAQAATHPAAAENPISD